MLVYLRQITLILSLLSPALGSLIAQEAEPTASTELSKLVDFDRLTSETVAMQCGQKMLVVYLGHADLPAVYHAAPGSEPEATKRLIEEYRRKDLAEATAYHHYLQQTKDNLQQSMFNVKPQCKKTPSTLESSIDFYSIIDGPGAKDTEISMERAQYNPQSQTFEKVEVHKNQTCIEFDNDSKKIRFPDECRSFELNIPESLDSLLKGIAATVQATQTVYILKGHGTVGYRFSTPRIKSLKQLLKSDYGFEDFQSYLVSERMLSDEARLSGLDFAPFSEQVRREFEDSLRELTPEARDSQFWYNLGADKTDPYSLHFMDIHGPDGEEHGHAYFSPIWDKATACRVLVEEMRFRDERSCSAYIEKQGSFLTQGPAERAQSVGSVVGGALPFIGDVGLFGSKTQTIKGGFNQFITSKINRDAVIQQWAKIQYPPSLFRILGKSLGSSSYPDDDQWQYPDFYSVGFPVGTKSASLLILDSCFGSTNLFRPTIPGHVVKPFEPAHNFDYPSPSRFDLPQRSLVQIFNNWPLFTDAISYKDLTAADLGLFANSLYGTVTFSTPHAVWNQSIQGSLKELSDRLIASIRGEKFAGRFDESRVFRRLFAGVTRCKHDVGYERNPKELDCKDEVHDSNHVHLESYKNRLEDFAQVIKDYEQRKTEYNWFVLSNYLSEMRFVFDMMPGPGLSGQSENLMAYMPVSSLVSLDKYAVQIPDESFRNVAIKWAKSAVETAERNFAALDAKIATEEFKKLAWLNAVYSWKYRKQIDKERRQNGVLSSTWYTDTMDAFSYLPNWGDQSHIILYKANWLIHRTCAIHSRTRMSDEETLDPAHPVRVMLTLLDDISKKYLDEFVASSPVPLSFKLLDPELEKRMDEFQLKVKDIPITANQADVQLSCGHHPLGLMPLPLGR